MLLCDVGLLQTDLVGARRDVRVCAFGHRHSPREGRVSENPVFTVELGPNYSVVLRVKLQDKPELVMPMKGLEAGLLGRSLLCAGAIAYADRRPADGTKITDGHLPAQNFFIDPESVRHDPVLLFELPGGVKLAFKLSAKMAEECGEVLFMARH